MAIDKVVDSVQLDTNLTSIANAIRGKAGLTASFVFPEGFVQAIAEIEAGGSGGDMEQAFIDLIERNGDRITSLPDGITKIGNSAFMGCKNLALTSLPEGLTTLDISAFNSCTNLALTSLPEGLTSIGNSAFMGCKNLALTSLPEGLTTLGTSAFSNCTSLALTSLPEGLTHIATQAFYNCTNLTSITFRGTPTTIHLNAFQACTNLLTINVPWAEGAVANAPWGATGATINYNYVEG